jgi:hypothetical protein
MQNRYEDMTPVETIIFLQDREISNRDYERFGIEPLQKEGFRVETWDISPVLHPDVVPAEQPLPPLPASGFLPKRLTGKGEIIHAIDGLLPSTLVICFIGYSVSTLFVYQTLSKRGIRYSVSGINTLPGIVRSMERYSSILNRDLPRKILSAIMNSLILRYYPLFNVQPAYLCLVGGEKSHKSLQYPMDFLHGRTILLAIHALDYDIYLQERDHPQPVEEDLAVYLDSNEFYHLDMRYIREPIPTWALVYFSNLRRFFDHLERELGVRVVIAAHPLAQYTPEQKAHFGAREVIQGRTAELVKRCRFAILHASTAVNLAVLFEKPVMFLTDHQYERYVVGPYVEAISKELGKKPIYLDEPLPTDWDEQLEVDRGTYQYYKRSYIKTEGSEDLPSWEILARFLKGG